MKKLLFRNKWLVIFILFTQNGLAQYQDRIWLFPDSAGIDFTNLSNPIPVSSNITNPCSNNFASICNNQGQLLFYSAGVDLTFYSQRVYDKFGNLMENGDSLRGYPWVGQGSMIIPMPDDSMKYYLFTGLFIADECPRWDLQILYKLESVLLLMQRTIPIAIGTSKQWGVANPSLAEYRLAAS